MHVLRPGRALAGIAAGATLALCGAAGATAPARAPSADHRAPARLPATTVAARQRFFGAAAVDRAGHVRRDRVILSWFGVSSLAASFRGHVVLLDTFVNGTPRDGCTGRRPPQPSRYVPAGYDDLAALRPEAIFIGHEHFDHACRTGELLVRTGATLVGLPQACDAATAQARAYAGRRARIRCVRTLGRSSPIGARRELRPLGTAVPVTVVRNLHSGPASAAPLNTAGAESVLFRFRVGRFSLVWNDSNGPLRERAPGLLGVLRRLPATDVVAGASLGLDVAEHGFRDAIDYPEALRAKLYLPLHHDLGSTDGSSRRLRRAVERELAGRTGLRARMRWLQDPGDYV